MALTRVSKGRHPRVPGSIFALLRFVGFPISELRSPSGVRFWAENKADLDWILGTARRCWLDRVKALPREHGADCARASDLNVAWARIKDLVARGGQQADRRRRAEPRAPKPCQICGRPFTPFGRATVCGQDCRRRRNCLWQKRHRPYVPRGTSRARSPTTGAVPAPQPGLARAEAA
jgi:hypothetical protein